MPHLIQLLEDRDPQVQRSAGTSLFAVAFPLLDNGKDARSAFGILSKLAEHTDVRNREDRKNIGVRNPTGEDYLIWPMD